MFRKVGMHRVESVLETVHSSAKVMFFWSVFLLVLEAVCFFGATAKASKVVDGIAIAVTCALLIVSLVGVKVVSFLFKRNAIDIKESRVL